MGIVYLLAVALYATVASAQSVIDYTKLPSCAHQCTILSQAEANCVPPAAPVTNQATYQSCVCQSALLTPFKTNGATCAAACSSTDDQNAISQYYISLCNGPVVEPATTTTATTTTSSSSTSTATGTAAAAGAAGAAGGNNGGNNGNKSWLSTHWKWVVMIAVIFAGIIIAYFLGLWLRRRIHRKREARRANMAAADAYIVESSPSTLRKFPHPQTPPPMAMSGGRSGLGGIDGNDSGIAPPRRPPRPRRRSTLQSITRSNTSVVAVPEPVAWGPHQYQAYRNASNGSPIGSGPPSPALPARNPIYGNERAMRSEPRFANYNQAPKGLSVKTSTSQNGTPGMPSPVSPIEDVPPRPATAKPRLSTAKEEDESTLERKVSRKLSKKRSPAGNS